MPSLVGRAGEQQTLREVLESDEAELVCVYGRRRIGKTFLVREFFASELVFELTGAFGGPLREQLGNFARAFADAFRAPESAPEDWAEAFARLRAALGRLPRTKRKRVLFFDELPWLCARRSGFLRAFEHFWNAWAVRQPWLVVVVCGSAAAWMIHKLLDARGGLHNRVTKRIRLLPFTLAETRDYLTKRRVRLGDYQTLELYMALGGVPQYLREVRRGESASQNIDRICFAPDGALRTEFASIYRSLFEHAERHERIVRALARSPSGLSRNALLAAAELPSGGAATTLLDELEASGFIMRMPAFGLPKKEAIYRLADEYSLFYLRWIEGQGGTPSRGGWAARRTSAAWRAWSGLAFEAVCLKHRRQIKRALGIEAVETIESAWSHRSSEDQGAQIDLVIDRRDATINVCEMKFSESAFTIDKRYAGDLRTKLEVFRRVTATRKALLLTMVTSYGVRRNAYRDEIVAANVEMGALFAP